MIIIPSFSVVAHAIGADELAIKLEELCQLVDPKMAEADPRPKDVRADPCGGRIRAQRVAEPNPREICALIVIEAWTLVHGDPPRAYNLRAQYFCEACWRARGGAPTDPGNWRGTIGAARKNNSAMRQSIRDQLHRKVIQNEF